VSSLSKAYGAPGIRVGWLMTRDRKLQELFLAAKEQISICGSVVDEWLAARILEKRSDLLAVTLAEMRRRRSLVRDWIEHEALLECVPPEGGVVCFPRMRGLAKPRRSCRRSRGDLARSARLTAGCELYVMHSIGQRSTHSSLRYGGNLGCDSFQSCRVRVPRSAE
jgi:aspartate/methionine/tyrosine aminotransferase